MEIFPVDQMEFAKKIIRYKGFLKYCFYLKNSRYKKCEVSVISVIAREITKQTLAQKR